MSQDELADQNAITIAAYDIMAPSFAERNFGHRLEKEMQRFTRHLAPGARVLDAGCGPGHDTAYLRELGYRAVGLDRSWGMLTEAQRREVRGCVCGDLRHLPFADGEFDGIWACASLLHFPRVEMPAALAELRRVLKGGVVLLLLKEGSGERWVATPDGQERFFCYFQIPELINLCQEAGLEALEQWTTPNQAGRPEAWLGLIARAG